MWIYPECKYYQMKALLFSILLFLIPQGVLSQKGLNVGFDVTIKHTGYSSWTNFKPFSHISIRPSFGIHLDYNFTDWFGLGSGMGVNLNTMERLRFNNNFTYVDFPLYLKLNIPVRKQSADEIRSFVPSLILGLNNQYLLRAVNNSSSGKESIKQFTEKYHYELTGGLGIKIRLRDNMWLDNYIIAAQGNPATSIEYNSPNGAITNMNLGIRTGFYYWFDAPNN